MLTKSGRWVELRHYFATDLPAMTFILNDGRSPLRRSWSCTRLREFDRADDSVAKVGVDEATGEVVVVLLYTAEGGAADGTIELRELAVRRDRRRDGIGRAVVRGLIGPASITARQEFVARVPQGLADLDAQLFFRAMKFELAEPRYDAEDNYVFRYVRRHQPARRTLVRRG